jgi:glycosyltransferase involved in cell wall biosynthesis
MNAAKRPHTASVVIPTCNEGEMLAMTVRSVLSSENDLEFEIVIVDDGSTDGSCEPFRSTNMPAVHVIDGDGLGVARARNLGAEHTGGEMIVFLDAHCEVGSHWLDHFAAAMAAPDVAIVSPAFTRLRERYPVGLGMGWSTPRLDLQWFYPVEDTDMPYEIPFAPGGCQAYPAATFRALGKFDSGFCRWGSEDIEISLRAWLLGFRVLAQPRACVAHWFRDTRAFTVDEADVAFNLLRMVRMHFTEPRLAGVLNAIRSNADITRVEQRLSGSDVELIRAELLAVRERDDAWFCDRFFPDLFPTSRGACLINPEAAAAH